MTDRALDAAQEQVLREELARGVRDGLVPMALVVAAVYAVLGPFHLGIVGGGAGLLLAGLALGSSALAFALFRRWRRHPPSLERAHALLALLAAILLVNSAVHMAIDPAPHQTTNFALLAIAAGFVSLSHGWLALTLAATAGSWAALAWRAPVAELWPHFTFFFAMALVIAATAHAVRVRNLRRLELAYLEARRSQAALQAQGAELTRAARLGTMGEMAAALAHELRQPLGAIVNYARGCSRRLAGGDADPEAIQQALDEICAEAERSSEIIRSTWKFARKEEPTRAWVSLGRVIRDVLQLVELEARRADVRVEVEPGVASLWVHADPVQTAQILINLLRNAIEAMRDAASEPRELHVGAAVVPEGRVEVRIRDTGPGIPPGLGDELFEPFATTKPRGLGLGLSVSRRIVESHGGRLGAEPHPEGGTTFHFSLPGREGRPPEADRPEPGGPPLG